MMRLADTPTRTDTPWTALHDATVVDLRLDWISGEFHMSLRSNDAAIGEKRIEATNLSSLQCPRHFPWRKSASVDEIHPPVQTREGSKLEILMCSGDLIIMLAESFEVVPCG
jgi:hypothetical protein